MALTLSSRGPGCGNQLRDTLIECFSSFDTAGRRLNNDGLARTLTFSHPNAGGAGPAAFLQQRFELAKAVAADLLILEINGDASPSVRTYLATLRHNEPGLAPPASARTATL